ncbi:hypothetical protein Ocin01_16921 [Orchesella cincta]|uniref:F-box domain-containing protein n=1 Tax=Orchesella cincta TaxID=48709 RepID=A0A1D2M9W3_ORCCI|nr:hypothetical protein Ocin01_16921 [Orchesella cincta]
MSASEAEFQYHFNTSRSIFPKEYQSGYQVCYLCFRKRSTADDSQQQTFEAMPLQRYRTWNIYLQKNSWKFAEGSFSVEPIATPSSETAGDIASGWEELPNELLMKIFSHLKTGGALSI